MPQSNMVLHVDFPDWDNYSDPIKSLINFMMKDSAVFYQGDYTGSTLNSFSGNVRTKYRSVMQCENDSDYLSLSESIELNIAYSDAVTYPADITGGLVECDTSLVTKSTTMKLLYLSASQEEASEFSDAVDPIDSINVTLTPKVGASANTDPTAKLHAMTDSAHLVTAPIRTDLQDFVSEYQLRTSSLFLDDGNGNIAEDIFWKIGIVPFNKKYPKSGSGSAVNTPSTVQGIKTALLDSGSGVFTVGTGGSYVASDGYSFTLQNLEFKYGSLADMTDGLDSSGCKVPLSFIIPVVTYSDSSYIIGLVYARMFKSDGSPVTESEVTGYNLQLYYKTSEDDQNPQHISYSGDIERQNMSLTDQNMDGGYIQSPSMD